MKPEKFKNLSHNFISKKQISFTGQIHYKNVSSEWHGTGIVIPAGGMHYASNAYMNIRYILDVLKSGLPIEIWYVGKQEYIDVLFNDLIHRYGDQISFVDAEIVSQKYPFSGNLKGYPIKPYCMTYSRFETIFFIDSDCFLCINPEKVLSSDLYKEFEALFCSDVDIFHGTTGRICDPKRYYKVYRLGVWSQQTGRWNYKVKNPLWNILNIAEDDLPEFESGLICINKSKHIDALFFALFLNEHHEFIYNYICGDKDTFKLAWSKYNNKLNLIDDIRPNGRMIEGYFNGQLLHQHRVCDMKYDVNKTLSDWPNSVEMADMVWRKRIFEETCDLIGSTVFDNQYIEFVNTENFMPGSRKELSQPYIQYVKKFIQDNRIRNILDIGCGDGLMLSNMEIPNSINITGIDISTIAVKKARIKLIHNNNIDIVHADAKNYSDNHYDLVLIKDVFQHLPFKDIYAILSNVSQKSKYMIITNDCQTKNMDIQRGGYRPINITDIYSPKFKDYLEYIINSDSIDHNSTKHIVVYENY